MYCQSCGSQVEAGNKFCESCGEGIEVEVQTNVESSNRKDKVTDSLNMLREKINVS
ncbi:zinc-ribbon domain-containing protein, partial [Turicibacter sanguinis]|uniref:zinc-ribbon domain-containing protein n=1 Tax=Turicibacter sanguinis TaxID=154288 RepID=UPI00374E1717